MNSQQEPPTHQLPSLNTINNAISLIQNILLIAGILGTIIGAITSTIYLIKINQTSILPNIFSNTTNLLAIIFAFGFLWLTLLLICIAPYFLAAIWLHKKIKINTRYFKKPIKIELSISFITAIISFLYLLYKEMKKLSSNILTIIVTTYFLHIKAITSSFLYHLFYYLYKKIKSIISFLYSPYKAIKKSTTLLLKLYLDYSFFTVLFLTPATLLPILLFTGKFTYISIFILFSIIPIYLIILYFYQYQQGKQLAKKNQNKLKINSKLDSDFYIATFSIPVGLISLFTIFTINILGGWILPASNNEYILWGFLITVYVFLLIINPLISGLLVSATNTNLKDNPKIPITIISSAICFMMYLAIAYFTPNFSGRILRMLHFVEFPTDSSWYLINNNLQKTDGSQEINGITSKDLELIKYKFSKYEYNFNLNYSRPVPYKIPDPPFDYKPTSNKVIKKYTKLDFQITFNTLFTTTEVLKNRKNALYGYMAWNLGDIKVFCPKYAKFTDNTTENKYSAKQCLLIDGKYLQILDDQYITSDLKP